MNKIRKAVAGAAIASTALVGGAVGASFMGSASAQDDGATTTTPSTESTTTEQTPHQANGVTETPLTGTDLEQATAAALAAVPGATVDRVETDADGATYEVHITNSDGTKSTVTLDASFTVTSVDADEGRGGGGHGGKGGPHEANGITETELTGDDSAKVTAAAQAAVPGATVDRVETDADGATYEAHVTKSDGTKATVKLDASFTVTSVEDGMK